MKEIWKAIPDYEGYYEVSNTGKVRSITRTIIDQYGTEHPFIGKELVLQIDSRGYSRIILHKDGILKTFKVHRLVAMVFLPNPDNLPCVNHKDENKLNNNVSNLEWCTVEYNNKYGTRQEKVSQALSLKRGRPVIMCDKDTHEPIKEFPNMKKAAEELGYKPTNNAHISQVIKGERKTALGYWWKYKD